MSNSDLFSKCRIAGIESLLITSQLRYVGHVVRMDDDRIPEVSDIQPSSAGWAKRREAMVKVQGQTEKQTDGRKYST